MEFVGTFPDFHENLMQMCVCETVCQLGPDAEHEHITFEAKVLYAMLLGWQSSRNYTIH